MSFDIKFTRQGFKNTYLLNCKTLLSDLTCILEAESGELDIKGCKPGILFISLLQTGNYDIIIDFSLFNTIHIIKKVINVYLIKIAAVR